MSQKFAVVQTYTVDNVSFTEKEKAEAYALVLHETDELKSFLREIIDARRSKGELQLRSGSYSSKEIATALLGASRRSAAEVIEFLSAKEQG